MYLCDTDLAFFAGHLKRYHIQHKEAQAVKLQRHLGVLLVDATQLKSRLAPSILRCLEVVTTHANVTEVF